MLLILAGITITFVLGEGGILEMAKEAAKRTEEAKQKELEDFANFSNQVENWINGGEIDEPFAPDTVKEAIEGKKKFTETKEITDGTTDKMWVPKDFTVTEGDKIDDGVVVKDSQGNEFVWAPVKDISTMVFCQNHPGEKVNYNKDTERFSCGGLGEEPKLAGKLYTDNNGDFEETKSDWSFDDWNYREPGLLGALDYNPMYDWVIEDEYEDFEIQLESEFKEMAKSVAKYGGFYIGRYETSGLDTEKPIVQKEKDSSARVDWYTMYKNSKILAQDKSIVTSSMIWGCQYDQVMLWMQNVDNKTKPGTKYIKDSSGMCWCKNNCDTGNPDLKTGVDLKEEESQEVLNRVKNIYDLAGCRNEWTLEACGDYTRVVRGYEALWGAGKPASERCGSTNAEAGVVDYYGAFSARVILYLD